MSDDTLYAAGSRFVQMPKWQQRRILLSVGVIAEGEPVGAGREPAELWKRLRADDDKCAAFCAAVEASDA